MAKELLVDKIEKVLKEYGGSMHSEVIAEEVFSEDQKLHRTSPPISSVSTVLRNEENNKFMDLGNSKYMLLDTPRRSSVLNSYAKHLSEFIKFPDDISDKELLDMDQILNLIVNFRLALVEDEVCFADILDEINIEFSNEEKKRHQLVDATLLRRKLEELKADIEKLQKEGNVPRNQYLDGILESLAKVLKKASESKVKVSVLLLGKFVIGKHKPKVVIYYKNIQSACGGGWTDVLAGVFIHEMFHAWNYFKAGRNSRSVLVIDEPMVEFETLYFLKQLETFTRSQSHSQTDKVSRVKSDRECRVKEKQQKIGDVAAYGFGYYLFNKLRDAESRHWIEAYSNKSDYIDIKDKSVYMANNALTPVYPFMLEEAVEKWMREVIFDGCAIPTTARKYALRKMVLTCIKTIGRKCFEAKEIYAFAPIFKICMPHCPNIEEALKQEVHELVKEHLLETLSDDCYCVKLD